MFTEKSCGTAEDRSLRPPPLTLPAATGQRDRDREARREDGSQATTWTQSGAVRVPALHGKVPSSVLAPVRQHKTRRLFTQPFIAQSPSDSHLHGERRKRLFSAPRTGGYNALVKSLPQTCNKVHFIENV